MYGYYEVLSEERTVEDTNRKQTIRIIRRFKLDESLPHHSTRPITNLTTVYRSSLLWQKNSVTNIGTISNAKEYGILNIGKGLMTWVEKSKGKSRESQSRIRCSTCSLSPPVILFISGSKCSQNPLPALGITGRFTTP